MASELRWRIKWEGEEYEWKQFTGLTLRRLRHFKQWFGTDYGKAGAFNVLWLQGDVDAYACVIWALLDEAGKKPAWEPPNMPDFSVGEMYDNGPMERVDTEEDDPTPKPTKARTKESTPTLTTSEPDTSDL